jgi:hypothetical protein
MIGKCAWCSDRVCACVETMRCEAMRLDSSGSYKTPTRQARSNPRTATADELRVASCTTFRLAELRMHISRVAAASTLYMSLKLQHVKFCLKRFCHNPSELFIVLGRVFDSFGNILQMYCQLILQYQLRILSYHIILYHMLN